MILALFFFAVLLIFARKTPERPTPKKQTDYEDDGGRKQDSNLFW
ncbi:hypothetical protein J2W15_002538 [Pseudarthrobacter sulfonivorans]|nr:hypothetical protein [Pseudarthrobacter sulfonivorans]